MRPLLLLPLPLALLACLSCATIEPVEPPMPPQRIGDQPAVGRLLDLAVEGRGMTIRLQGVVGRVTAVCVLGEAPDADAAGGEGSVLEACQRLAARLGDRVAVVALTTNSHLDLDHFPIRTYRDPGGKALRSNLELDTGSRVIVVDTRRRVAELLAPGELDRLVEVARKLTP